MSNRLYHARTAIYIVTVPTGFKPQRPWSIPDTFTQGEIYARNLTNVQARSFVRVFNATAIHTRDASPATWDCRWALVSPCVKVDWTAAAAQGGAL